MYSFVRPDIDSSRLREFAANCKKWIGHNVINYDLPVVEKLIGHGIISKDQVEDTYIMSLMYNFDIPNGHSLEAWGVRLGFPKISFNDFSRFSKEMLEYCKQDVLLTSALYTFLSSRKAAPLKALHLEQDVAILLREMHHNGFPFDDAKAKEILAEVTLRLQTLDDEIRKSFPPKSRQTEERFAKTTKEGGVSRVGLRWYKGDIERDFTPDAPFCVLEWEEFNPGSVKQMVEKLADAGWKPTEKTKTHLEWERLRPSTPEESKLKKEKLKAFKRTGWKVSETNMATLPEDAPDGAKHLVERMFYASRGRTLTEWLEATDTEIEVWVEKKDKESMLLSGPAVSVERTLSGDLSNRSTTGKDENESVLKPLEHPMLVSSGTMNKKNVNVDTISEMNTVSRLSDLMRWLSSKARNVSCVEKGKGSWSIIVMRQGSSEDYSVEAVTQLLDGLKEERIKYAFTSRVRGWCQGIGTWTQRASHRSPNTANIAAEKSLKYSSPKMSELAKQYGKRMRSLWCASRGHMLVGTDAEGIQLRVLAHYLGDKDYADAIVNGDKAKGTDVHSINQRTIGPVCSSRDSAKTFIYALLLGAGVDRIASILNCSKDDAQEARDRFIKATPGFEYLKRVIIPRDAQRGYFVGFDGRKVRCDSEHLMLAGYLQNGEVLVMKYAMRKWYEDLQKLGIWFKLVNFVHDEWQTLVMDDKDLATLVGKTQADAIKWAGEHLNVKCPLAGSYSIGYNWYETH